MHSAAVLQHRASLDPACSLVPTQLFPHIYSTAVFSSTLPSPFSHSLFSSSFFFLFFSQKVCVLLASHCRLLLLGPLRVCSKSRQPLSAFAPNFIRNSGPYPLFSLSVRNSICLSGMVASCEGRLNPVRLEDGILEVSSACKCESIRAMHKKPCELLNNQFK